MKPKFLSLKLAVLTLLTTPLASAGASEELILFTRSTDSPATRTFHDTSLPKLEQAAEELGLALRSVDITDGAPAEVKITPLIVYQNHRGRSIFQARTSDPGKLVHFIRTSRAIPPSNLEATRQGVPVLEEGRSRTLAPLKITALRGNVPEGHDPQAFQKEAEEAILRGFEHFGRRDEVTLGPADRQFYMDFHPYLSEDGMLSVSTALFSQFHCIEPVFQSLGNPAYGPWSEADQVFARAAGALEKEVLLQIRESTLGDGFDPVPASVTERSWEEMGLPLPSRPAGATADTADIELGRHWRIEKAQADVPRLIFRFPAPLERYTGEVDEIAGELHFPEDLTFGDATGTLEATTATVTMGESSLDKALRGKMLLVERFPAASFELERFGDGVPPLAFGRPSQFLAYGKFRMMGTEIPLDVRGEIEPVIGEDGTPRLRVNASFRIRLESPFGIEGPDGPAPANDTLIFYLDFLMKEAQAS